jgi:hypothetical protein
VLRAGERAGAQLGQLHHAHGDCIRHRPIQRSNPSEPSSYIGNRTSRS